MANRRTSLHDWHVSHKARMVPFGGWDMPVQYTGIIDEHKAVRTAAGLFDVSHMARIDFHGPDAIALLEHVDTNAIVTMKEGQVRYGLLCNETGGMLDDVLVYRYADRMAMVANASNREKVLNHLRKHAEGRKVDIQDHTESTTLIALQGPRSVEMMAGIVDAEVSSLKYYFALRTTYKGSECVVSRTGYTGEDGFEIAVPNTHGVSLWNELMHRGAAPCGLGARDTLRLEAAMPLYGHELSETMNPIHAGLAWAVKLDKEFLGKSALVKATQDSSAPVRVGLELEGSRAAREGVAVVAADGQHLGTVTSGSYVPWLEKSIAMAYVPPEFASVGKSLFVDVRGTKIPAHVVTMPFYKRKK